MSLGRFLDMSYCYGPTMLAEMVISKRYSLGHAYIRKHLSGSRTSIEAAYASRHFVLFSKRSQYKKREHFTFVH